MIEFTPLVTIGVSFKNIITLLLVLLIMFDLDLFLVFFSL